MGCDKYFLKKNKTLNKIISQSVMQSINEVNKNDVYEI